MTAAAEKSTPVKAATPQEKAEKEAKEILAKAKAEAKEILADAEAKAAELQETDSEEQNPVDANDLLNQAWASLASTLDDGVAKDQVLGALTAVQLRARDVVVEHKARQDNE